MAFKKWKQGLTCFVLFAAAAVLCVEAKVVCEDGMCRIVDDDAPPAEIAKAPPAADSPRIAQGYMPADRFVAFLRGEDEVEGHAGGGVLLLVLMAILGGLAMNLTPCVLPMIPVNLIVIGRSARRGVLYGLGMALAYGALGVAAAVGGMAFGSVQSSPVFNLAVAVVFAVLGLSLCGRFSIDFSRFRRSGAAGASAAGWAVPVAMGALSAVLAGACVAPVLIAVLVLTADLFARGEPAALALPFAMGVGMALPWPFAAAGMKVLPKPGAWMRWVNRAFAAIVFALAAWHASLAVRAWLPESEGPAPANAASGGAIEATPATFSLDGLRRPVLVDCWASWCKNCAAMDSVMDDAKVKEELSRFTVMRLRAEDMGELLKLPGFGTVRGLPAFAIFE